MTELHSSDPFSIGDAVACVAEDHFRRARVLAEEGRIQEAEASYRTALEIRPDYPEAIHNLALLRLEQADYESAERFLRGLLAEFDGFVDAHMTMGRMLNETSRIAEAQYHYRRAIALEPTRAEAHTQLGNVLRRRERLTESIASLHRALELDASSATAYNNLAACYFERGNHEKADALFQESIKCNPQQRHAWHNWLLLSNLSTLPREEVYARHLKYGQHIRGDLGPPSRVYPKCQPSARKRLRVGFVSGDFRRHSVAYFLLGPLRAFDRETIEPIAFQTNLHDDAVTEQLRPLFAQWFSLAGLTDADAANLISAAAIDILVDLAGHTGSNAFPVFARAPAPVQVAWLGYPNTTGLDVMDYRLTDTLVDPDDGKQDQLYTERLVRLPSSFIAYTPAELPLQPNSVPLLSNGYVTFGSFNTLVKLTGECILLWADVLKAVPNSRLVIKSHAGLADKEGQDALRGKFAAHGVAPERIVPLAPKADTAEHLALYHMIDIGLDPTPYNGTTTTCEAFWMGVPVLTLRGEHHLSRVGSALLARVGLDDFIADSPDAFVRQAVQLAGDPARLAAIRAGLRQRMESSPLMDSTRLARDLELAFREMWRTYCAGPVAALAATERKGPWSLGALATDSSPEHAGRLCLPTLDGGTLAVPEDPSVLTTYVLLEQRRWFERELPFLIRALDSGGIALDIGANVGAYAVPMALKAGPGGRVHAYEPGHGSRTLLEASAAENQLENLLIEPVALSNKAGTGYLQHGEGAEFRSLVAAPGSATDSGGDAVAISALDDEARRHQWQRLDVIKIDAEGHEARIVAGGKEVLNTYSPLVMFEVNNAGVRNHELQWMFVALGYRIFRLAGDEGYLVPVADDEPLDPMQLNLFAAKPERMAILADRGLLVADLAADEFDSGPFGSQALAYYCQLPFAQDFHIGEEDVLQSPIGAALVAWAVSHMPGVPLAVRHAALLASTKALELLCGREPTLTRLMTFARCLNSLGMRARAVDIARRARGLCDSAAGSTPAIDEPFLPILGRFDHLSSDEREAEWVVAQIDEAIEVWGTFSSFNRAPRYGALEALCRSAFVTPDLVRRLILDAARDNVPEERIAEFLDEPWLKLNGLVFGVDGYRILRERLGLQALARQGANR